MKGRLKFRICDGFALPSLATQSAAEVSERSRRLDWLSSFPLQQQQIVNSTFDKKVGIFNYFEFENKLTLQKKKQKVKDSSFKYPCGNNFKGHTIP
jgi:hypothetical protein